MKLCAQVDILGLAIVPALKKKNSAGRCFRLQVCFKNKLLTTKSKTLNLLQTAAQGERNTRMLDGKASVSVTSLKTNGAS